MSKYIVERLGRMEAYTPGEQVRGEKIIKLNTNENPFPPPQGVCEAISAEAERLRLYPDITGGALTQSLGIHFGVPENCVFAGNGSDEILAFCFQALCPQGVAFADLTYGFYQVYADLYEVDSKIVPLREDFSLHTDDYNNLRRTIVIANPNAPTGLALSRVEVERIVRSNSENLVIVDEAYVDFGAESCVPLLERYENLLVVGTFSKSRSLAGARLGYAVGRCELIEDLNRMRFSFNPYNVNQLTLAAGAAALAEEAYFKSCKEKIIQTRENTTKRLREMGFQCTDSQTNFVFATHPSYSAQRLYEGLKEKNILIRWFNKPRIVQYLRITIGLAEEMDEMLQALEALLEE